MPMIQPYEPAAVDYIAGQRGHGDVADKLLANNMDVGILRPWKDEHGRTCVALYNEKTKKKETVVVNSPSTLAYDTWKLWDEVVIRAARPILNVWGDIFSEPGLRYDIANGLDFMVLLHQKINDVGAAAVSFNGLSQTNRDRNIWDYEGIPLPLIHHDFSFDWRDLRVAAKQSLPLDTTLLENSVYQVARTAEDLMIGNITSPKYAGYQGYGLTTYPYRIATTMTLPTSAGWTPKVTKDEIIAMIQAMRNNFMNGPYGVWFSPGWWQYFQQDYSLAQPGQGQTLMSQLKLMPGVKFWNQADLLTNFQMIIVDLKPTFVQAVQGVKMTTVQWEGAGGMEKYWKVLAMMLPRLRRNSNGNTGVNHGVAA